MISEVDVLIATAQSCYDCGEYQCTLTSLVQAKDLLREITFLMSGSGNSNAGGNGNAGGNAGENNSGGNGGGNANKKG